VIHTCLTKHASEHPCQYRHVQTWMPQAHGPYQYHSKPHMLPHTPSPPPMAPYTLPPSLPHSPKRRELVKDARRQHADRVVGQVEDPGHDTRRQSALTHSTSTCPLCPSACTCNVPHAHAPCTCPVHMPHAHAHAYRGSLSLSGYAHTVHACAHVHVPLVINIASFCSSYKIPM
jgi:hypothetical protein